MREETSALMIIVYIFSGALSLVVLWAFYMLLADSRDYLKRIASKMDPEGDKKVQP